MFKLKFRSPDFLIAISEIFSKIATFIIIPLAGLILSTKSFNLWSIVFPSIQVLSAALSFGLPTYVLRSFYRDEIKNKSVILNQIYIYFLLLLFVSAGTFLVIKSIKMDNTFFRWDIYIVIITSSFLLIIQQKYQAEKKGFEYLMQSLIWRNIFALVFIAAIFLHFNLDFDHLLRILLTIQMILCLWSIFNDCRPFILKIDIKTQLEIFKFGFPLFLIGILQYLISINGRYFVFNKGFENDTAIFSIIQTFIGGLNLLFVVFVRIYVPKLFNVLSGNNTFESLHIYKSIIFPLFEILGMLILLFLFIYSFYYKNPFDDMILILASFLILGQFFYGIQIFVSDSIVYYGHTIKLLVINCITTVLSLILGYFLVNKYGVIGGALSVTLTQFISLFSIIIVSRKLFLNIIGFNYFFKTVFKLILALCLFYFIYQYFGKYILIFLLIFLISIYSILFINKNSLKHF